MGNCLSTIRPNPSLRTPVPDATATAHSAAVTPAVVPSLPESPSRLTHPEVPVSPGPSSSPIPPNRLSPVSTMPERPQQSFPLSLRPSDAPFKVFISHAGEDKVTIAFPLREKLRQRGITAFVDKIDMSAGAEAESTMNHAMHTASVGVFVMSPEFVARKWPMKELMHFLKRRYECKASGIEAPLIIPMFYRLGLRELYDEPRLDRNDKHGMKLYDVSRFSERQRSGEPEANIAAIKAALTQLHDSMGVENILNANNDSSYKMHLKREMLLEMLCDKICEAVAGSLVEGDITCRTSEEERDTFYAYFDKEYDVSELVFDFDRKDDNGDVCTQEGKILRMLLDDSENKNQAITVQGIAGVGKTSLLRKIRGLDRISTRFKDGVYHVELGKDATATELKAALISLVSKSGGKQTAKKMCNETDVRNVIEAFRSWFSEKACLFMIDDVWVTKEVSRETIRDLRNLHASGENSKTLLTTRSREITADGKACFFLRPRDPLEDDSRAILYHYADLKPESTYEEDNKAVNDILKRCAGLPLFLCVAGKGVKTLSFRLGHEGCMAYRCYADKLKISMGEMITKETELYDGLSARLKISIELVEERRNIFDFHVGRSMAEMHRRLSVMKKQVRVPMKMLKHLWELNDESEAARIAKEFEQVGLADVEFEKQEHGVVEMLRLHDSVYEFAVYETKVCREDIVGHATLLEGYMRTLKTSDTQGRWWSEDLEDDKYIHRNVCRHLVGAGFDEELIRLLLSPKWLERQVELNGVTFAEDDFSTGIKARRMWKAKSYNRESDEVEEALEMIEEAIVLSSWYILKNRRESLFQVHGRLKRAAECNSIVREYVTKIESNAPQPGVLCVNGLLMEAGGANTRIISVGSAVVSMALFKDGKRVACGCFNGDIAIVNIHENEIEARWRGHDKYVNTIAVEKDGMRIVSGADDATGKVWDVQTGDCLVTFDGHEDNVQCVAITDDGKRVVSASRDRTIQVWDTESGQRVRTPITREFSVFGLALFKDGEHVVIGGGKGGLEIWNVTTNKKVGASFDGFTNGVRCIALTPDETRFVTGSAYKTVQIWDVESRQQVGESFKGHTDWVRCVAISDDGRRIVSGSDDNTIRVWDVENGQELCDLITGHTNWIAGVSFFGKGDMIVSGSFDENVREWKLNGKMREMTIAEHSGRISDVSFTPDGGHAVSGSWDGTLRMWSAISGQAVGEALRAEHCSDIYGLVITPDGRFVVAISKDNRARLWDLQAREVVRTFEGHTNTVLCVALTPGGERAVTGSEDKSVRIWDLKSGDGSQFVLTGHDASVTRVFVSDDGKRIISMDKDASIFVWDIEMKTEMKRMKKEALHLPRERVLELAGEATYDSYIPKLSPAVYEILHMKGRQSLVLGTLETLIFCWDLSPDTQTVCVGLADGRVGFLRVKM